MSMFNRLPWRRSAAEPVAAAPSPERVVVRTVTAVPRRGGQRSSFAAAEGGNLYAGWATSRRTTDAILRDKWGVIVARSRQLAADNPWVKRYLSLAMDNIIGSTGIRFQSRARLKNGKLDWKSNKIIETAWAKQRRKGNFTVNGIMTGTDAERLFVRLLERDGEVFVRIMEGGPGEYKFGVQFIPAECIDHQLVRDKLPNGNYIYMGIEYDPTYDRPAAYWVLTHNPNGDHFFASGNRRYMRVPAEDMIHAFYVDDIQTRGLPSYMAGMADLKMLSGYVQAELVAARAGASKMGFYKRTAQADPYSDAPHDYAEGGEGDAEGLDGEGEGSPGLGHNGGPEFIEEAIPGHFGVLPEGWEFQAFDPQHPSVAFDSFVKASLRAFSSSTGAAGYNSVANDLEKVNYTSMRAGRLTETEAWRGRQAFTIDHFEYLVFCRWLRWTLNIGALGALRFDDFDRLCAPEFRCRGWVWVDPKKEAEGQQIQLAMKVTSRTAIAADQGKDLEDIFAEVQAEEELAKRYGVDLSAVDKALAAAPPPAQPPAPPEDDEEDKEEGDEE